MVLSYFVITEGRSRIMSERDLYIHRVCKRKYSSSDVEWTLENFNILFYFNIFFHI